MFYMYHSICIMFCIFDMYHVLCVLYVSIYMFYMYHVLYVLYVSCSICSICIILYVSCSLCSICIILYVSCSICTCSRTKVDSDVQYGSMFVTVATNAASVSAVPLPPSSHWYEVTRSVLLGAVLSN